MRKSSSEFRRPSLSGAPLRVRQENLPSHGSRSSSMERASSSSTKLPVSKRMSSTSSSQQYRPRQSSMGRGNIPDLRKSSSMSQNSFLPKSGRPSSGIGVRGRTDVPKDSRPISDKRFQNQCIASLLEFLTSHQYPHPISHKLLGSPSNKDFSNIFEFIMGHFWDDFKQQGSKLQELVPSTLRLLGYPFNLPKTFLCSVGSPHTWPHLLAALTWMIDLLQIQNLIGGDIDRLMFEPTGDDFDGIPDEKISFDYRERTFSAFMAGADTFEEENQVLERIFMEKYHGGDINNIIEENKRLENMIDDTEKMEDNISALKEHCKIQKQNEKQFRDYLEQMQRHKMALLAEMEKGNEELIIIKSDLEKEESRLQAMQIAYEGQELKPSDVERLKAEKDRLHAQIEQLEKQMADISTDNWKVNMEQAKHNEKLEVEVAKYNRHAIALKLVPESAEFADGKDFRLHVGFSSDLVMDFHHNVKTNELAKKAICILAIRFVNVIHTTASATISPTLNAKAPSASTTSPYSHAKDPTASAIASPHPSDEAPTASTTASPHPHAKVSTASATISPTLMPKLQNLKVSTASTTDSPHPHAKASTESETASPHPHAKAPTESATASSHPHAKASTASATASPHPHAKAPTESATASPHSHAKAPTESATASPHPHAKASTESATASPHPHAKAPTESATASPHPHAKATASATVSPPPHAKAPTESATASHIHMPKLLQHQQ
ncbi:hypothetical protein RRG08_020761 [Elysia crispata]|uniref:Kinetochore protein NDC80 n=1 Tax=Elysia crispata TaxID=231223 RepID=A0AAE1E3I8_9GAST|nr:hypothetical protein RRG08_020761 [Elysia crispata]